MLASIQVDVIATDTSRDAKFQVFRLVDDGVGGWTREQIPMHTFSTSSLVR